jgi:putative hydroxymethylpyrimidine transport system ATP-binding protein
MMIHPTGPARPDSVPEIHPAVQLPAVQLRGAALRYAGRLIFDGLDLDLPTGSWTCLLGPSGVGKSSLLRLIAGLEPLEPSTTLQVPPGGVTWMSQQDLLLPWLNVRDNVLLGRRLRGQVVDQAARNRADDLLHRVGLEDYATQRPGVLSGGMRQRAALARTLAEDRPVVVMDEPFSALDAISRLRLQELAATVLADRTVLLVTHDPLEALRLGHRVLVLQGRPARLSAPICPAGPPARPVNDPALLALQGELLELLSTADDT